MYLSDINTVDQRVVESPEMLGKECIGCLRILAYGFYQRDSSYRDGHRDLCIHCSSQPRLSISEHTIRQQEMNENVAKRRRWENQEDYENDEARVGHTMNDSDFIHKLRTVVSPSKLYITPGRVEGDWALFKLYPCPQPQLNGRDFEYLFYCPMGVMPEFSQYEFDARRIPVREKRRGWRTVLLRLIKANLVTEEQANEVFGHAEGPASTVWYRQLYAHRNR